MEITPELLKTLYRKVNQYCLIRYNREPNEIVIEEDHITVDWDTWDCFETHTIQPQDLNQDMDELDKKIRAERIQEKKRAEELALRLAEERSKREREARRLRYEELRKEFGE